MNIIVFDSGIAQPENKGILLKDIIENGNVDRDKSLCLTAGYYDKVNEKRYYTKAIYQIVYNNIICHSLQPRMGKGKGGKGHLKRMDGKSYCLDISNSMAIEYNNQWRKFTPIEMERLQTIPDNYTDGVSKRQRGIMLGNGWTVDIIGHILKYLK